MAHFSFSFLFHKAFNYYYYFLMWKLESFDIALYPIGELTTGVGSPGEGGVRIGKGARSIHYLGDLLFFIYLYL